MIVFLYLCQYLLLYFFSFHKFHKKINILMIFNTIWYFFGLVSCFGIISLRIPSIKVHVLIWVFTWTVSLSFMGRISNRTNYNNKVKFKNDLRIIVRRAKFIQVLGFLLILPMVSKVFSSFVASGSLATVRNLYFSDTNFSSMYLDLVFKNLPIGLLQSIVIVYAYLSFETRRFKYIIFAFFNAAFVTLINGGRYTMMMLIYVILVLWMLYTPGWVALLPKGYKKRVKGILFALLLVMVSITLSRGQKIWNSIIVYFSGSLSFLDYIMENPSQFALDAHLYGYLTFGAFLEPFVLVLKVLGITSAKVPSYEFNVLGQQYYNIGADGISLLFNANTSVLYYFLRDFGFFGIVIGGLFLSFLWSRSYNNWKSGDTFSTLVFLYLCSVMFNTLMTYQLFGQGPFIMIATFLFCTQHRYTLRKAIPFLGGIRL
jgi:oligosaccharide repeat unit polymerase